MTEEKGKLSLLLCQVVRRSLFTMLHSFPFLIFPSDPSTPPSPVCLFPVYLSLASLSLYLLMIDLSPSIFAPSTRSAASNLFLAFSNRVSWVLSRVRIDSIRCSFKSFSFCLSCLARSIFPWLSSPFLYMADKSHALQLLFEAFVAGSAARAQSRSEMAESRSRISGSS